MDKCSCSSGEGTRSVDIIERLAICRACHGIVNELPNGVAAWQKDGVRVSPWSLNG